jgi:hypothetical protein
VFVELVEVLVFLSVTNVLLSLLTENVFVRVCVAVIVLEALAVKVMVVWAEGLAIRHEHALLTALGALLGR